MARFLLQGFAVDESGNVLSGATVTITHTLTAATATLYDARTGGSTVSNPVTSDSNGQWSAYVDAGLYTTVVSSGSYTETVSHIPGSEVNERDVGVSASTDIPDRAAADTRYCVQSNDLSDVASASTARTNLGLGTVATLASGTGSGDVRTNTQNESTFLQQSNNLSDVNTASTARSNLGLGASDNVTFNTITGNSSTIDSGTFETVEITNDTNSPVTYATITWTDNTVSPISQATAVYDDTNKLVIDTAVAVTTIDTGQGAVECYAMDQAVRTTDDVTFNSVDFGNEDLDDYDEGGFTPEAWDDSLTDELSAGDYDYQIGEYIKIGNTVHFFIRIKLNSLGTLTTTHSMRIGNLPVASKNVANAVHPIHVGLQQGMSLGGNYQVSGYINNNSTYLTLRLSDSTAGGTNLLLSEFSATGDIGIAGSYLTD